ncbi:uncharacterized protein LOC144146489 [Haemaphysalis longicornis]
MEKAKKPRTEEVVTNLDIERLALNNLPQDRQHFFADGADLQQTLRENRLAFLRLRHMPRMLRGVAQRDQCVTLLGCRVSLPVGFSPTSYQKMAHPEGEKATVRAAQATGAVMILSIQSTTSLEDVSAAAPGAIRWFNTYIFKQRDLTQQLVKRAEKAGYKAIVVTIDVPLFGRKIKDVKNHFDLAPGLTLANFGDADFARPTKTGGTVYEKFVREIVDQALMWDSVAWLRSITTLPLVIKGIVRVEDAVTAVDRGADAIVVSNHGARQLDGTPATIELLPDIVRAVGDRCEVYLDGGVRLGTDVTKALSLGARAVFVGRPVIWGLAYDGQKGVEKMVNIFKEEIDRAMALLGCSTLEELTPDLVVREESFSKL